MNDTLSQMQLCFFIEAVKTPDFNFAESYEEEGGDLHDEICNKHGLLQYDSRNGEYMLTTRGRVYLEHLLSVALPIHVWVIPNSGEEYS